jgi:hypothetical protein
MLIKKVEYPELENQDKTNEEFRNDEIFIQDLRSEYRNVFDLKSSLDTKANSIITASIISSSLLVSITTLFLTSIKSPNSILYPIIGLIIGVVLSVVTVLLSMEAYRIRGYMYSVVSSHFFDETGKLIESNLVEIREASKKEFYSSRIEDYLYALNHNEKENTRKAKIIIASQILFILSISFLLGAILSLLGLLIYGNALIKL